ncbi:MAG TPA: type II secretion system minor pseudopilin GspK [Noviherbaspirillum sp.]|uniref:type II secretion system minor pseudopilin GspK n=1 Tax=Noviherbaspirillum sp. TaxID=1926288 RepID=UPI002B4919AF|nr:type II secretion system minor pseudopilin GspK [Noviherbaspirillum sp.]HJV87229.1 type II secretion system minor pseudopilin GspK [Noviherbaspirillum sp.]
MRKPKRRPIKRERGVAVITALLLTTLAITIVASLFWQQQVQVRSIENQRLQLQKQWILRGALDWTRLILREDKRISPTVDHLGEPWAVPLAETRLDQYVENAQSAGDVPDAALSGGIIDAQSRFNLTNLCPPGGPVDQEEVATFSRLLSNVGLNPGLAQATADLMLSALAPAAAGSTTQAQPVTIAYVDDLLAVPGFTPEMVAKLKDFVVVLPKKTEINVNTAPPEVLAARIATLSLSEAATLVSRRESAWFKTQNEFTEQLPKQTTVKPGSISVNTNYFLVNGRVRLSRATMEMQALIDRSGRNPEIRWIREN